MKGERSAEERAEQCPSLFYFLQRLIHVRTSGPDIRADYQSTIAAPEATGHGLAQTHSVSERERVCRPGSTPHCSLQPDGEERRARRPLKLIVSEMIQC